MSRNIPDFGRSYVPVTQMQMGQSTIPRAPEIAPQEDSPISKGLMTAIQSGALTKDNKSGQSPWEQTKDQMSGIGNFLKGDVEAVGKDLNASGSGNDAFNMLDSADMAQDSGGSPRLAALGSLLGLGGSYANGGTVGSNLLKKYKGHKAHALIAHHWGEANTDKWLSGPQNHDDVPKHIQYAVDNDLLKSHYASGGIVGYARGGMSLDPRQEFMEALNARSELSPMTGDLNKGIISDDINNNFGQNNPLTHLGPFGSPATPEPMGMSNIGANEVPDNFDPHNLPPFPLNMPQGGMTQESTLPDVPVVPSEQAGMASASSPSQGIAQATSLDELKDQLKANEPVLDKWQAIAMAGAGMMAGKNRSALTNIGEGVQAGLSDYAQQKANIRDYGLKESEVKQRAQQLAVEAERYNKMFQMEQEKLDQGKYTTQPGYGKDDKGNDVPGVYRFNSKSQEAPQFIPGVVTSSGIGKSPVAQLQQRLQIEHPEWTPEQAASEATKALESGKQEAKVSAAADTTLQKGLGSNLAKTQKQWTDQATSAQLANSYIDSMKNETDKFRMGWGSDAQRTGKQVLEGLSKTLGIDTPDMDKSLGSQQAFNKTAMQMVMDKTRSVSSRAAYGEMQAIQSGMPTELMSANGFDTVTSQMRGINEYNKALAKVITDPAALTKYKESHDSSMSGFDNDVLDKVSPAVFWLKNLPVEDRTKIMANMKSNDHKQYESIIEKIKYAKDNGLM